VKSKQSASERVEVFEPPPASGRGEIVIHETLKAIYDLRSSIDELRRAVEKLDDRVHVIDEHNGILHDSIVELSETMEDLAGKLDLVRGVGKAVRALIPRRRD
jgi:chromosome segregation ATPase